MGESEAERQRRDLEATRQLAGGRGERQMSEDDDDDGDEGYIEELKELLEEHGIHLPAHTSKDTIIRDLGVALHTANNMDADDDADEGDLEDGAQREMPSALTMSLGRAGAGRQRVSQARGQAAAREILRNAGMLPRR